MDKYTYDKENPNKGTGRGRRTVKESIKRLGAGRSIVVDADGNVIAGNKTLEQARELGIEIREVESDGSELIVVKRTDLDLYSEDDIRGRELSFADNRSGELGLSWNIERVLESRALLEQASYLFTEAEQMELKARLDAARPMPNLVDGPIKVDDLDKFVEKWGTESGQVWSLGRHKMVIGDVRDERVLRDGLFDGGKERAHVLFTSPPYWLGLDYESEKSEEEIREFIFDCVSRFVNNVSTSFGRMIINTGTCSIHRIEKKRRVEILLNLDVWQDAFREYGWLLRNIRVWGKSAEFGTASISPKVDMVEQGSKFIGLFMPEEPDWGYFGSFWNPAGDQRGQNRVGESWAQQGLWTGIRGNRSAGGKHVAAMATELAERFLRLYSIEDEIVLDPFLGSGTTIIAAEKWGRICYGVERDPRYAASCLERISQVLRQEIILESTTLPGVEPEQMLSELQPIEY